MKKPRKKLKDIDKAVEKLLKDKGLMEDGKEKFEKVIEKALKEKGKKKAGR